LLVLTQAEAKPLINMEKFSINKKLISFFCWSLASLIFGITACLASIYLYLSPNLPSIESLRDIELQTPLRIYSIDNKLIGEFGEKRRDPINIEDAPQALIDAILSAEDDSFYEHRGVSIKSLFRAASQLALSGEIQSGGSTITMQVARNFFLTREQTFSRKFNEILLALKIEQALSKQEILELYINKIYLGNRAYGFKAAAQSYYGKDLSELTLAQIAMCAGLPKAPSRYNPIANAGRALIRRDWILNRMHSLNKITTEQLETAINEPVSARYHGQKLELNAPYVAEAAREKALELFGEEAYTNGYKIITTVNSTLQETAQNAIVKGLMSYDNRHGYRGPEQQLDPSLLIPLENQQTAPNLPDITKEAPTETTNQETLNAANTPGLKKEGVIKDVGIVNLIPWLESIKKIPSFGKLEPAVVIRIGENYISALTALGTTVDVQWENGLENARRYVDENFATDKPKSPDKVVDIGDVIRIYENEQGLWHFSQVPDIEAALISLSPNDGSIQSIVGGFDFNHSSFNRALQAKRQPGSNFKPFIYTIGLENEFTPASILNDAPIVVQDDRLESTWRPENASGKFYGPTRLRKALYLSRNLVSIRLLRSLGIGKTVKSLSRFGLNTSDIPRDLSMALGSFVMTPMEVAVGYSVFANGGYKVEPFLIHHIRDRHDNILYKSEPTIVPDVDEALVFTTQPKSKETFQALEQDVATPLAQENIFSINTEIGPSQDGEENETESNYITVELETKPAERVIDERIVYLMNSMLRDVIKRGTGRKAQSLGRNDLAGKTGTTNGPTDAWFSGYNADLVTTTWVGFDNNNNLGRGEYGGVAALPIWIDFMKVALEGLPENIPTQPDGVLTVRIDPETGERASPSNPNAIFELFLEETAPPEFDESTIISGGNNNPAPEDLF
jgi:penicillin-binding protein 1A